MLVCLSGEYVPHTMLNILNRLSYLNFDKNVCAICTVLGNLQIQKVRYLWEGECKCLPSWWPCSSLATWKALLSLRK